MVVLNAACLHKPSADQGDTLGLAAEQQWCTFTGRNALLSFPATPCLHSQPPAKQTVLQISLQITPRLPNPPESAINPEPCSPCPHTGSPLLRGGCLVHSELQRDSPCVFLFRIRGEKQLWPKNLLWMLVLEVNNRHRMKVSSLSTSVAQIRDNNVAQSDIVETKPALNEWKLRPVSLEGKNQRKAHTSAVNNDQQHRPNGNSAPCRLHRERVRAHCAKEMSAESSLEKGLWLFMLAKWLAASCSSVQTS